jgi:cardiolipin synthase A/B
MNTTYIWGIIVLLLTIIGWLIPFVMLFIVPANRKPSSATAWLMLLFAVPWLGLLIFLLVGSPKLSAFRRKVQQETNEAINAFVAEAQADPQHRPLIVPDVAPRYEPLVKLNANLGGLPALTGNAVELITDYAAMLAQIAEDINSAKYFVHIAFYILIADDETEACFQAMERAVARGVRVRVLYDPVGSRKYPTYRATLKRLRDAKIDHQPMLPVIRSNDFNRPDLRNHRKIVVIDGEIGYTGSLNMIARAYHRNDSIYYDELVARVTGPATDALDAVFRTDWFSETGERLPFRSGPYRVILRKYGDVLCQVLPSGSAFENENNLKLFVALIHASRRKVVICNPYFVPDDALMLAVVSAAQRGVDVTLINSEAQDQFLVAYAQRSYYEQLLRAGVKIRLYRAPTLLHTKTISIDDDIAVIGSSNLDMRSFQLNLEVTLICYAPSVVADLRTAEECYIERTNLVTLETWLRRPPHIRLFENVTRLMSAFL